jgi:hypothetical protein
MEWTQWPPPSGEICLKPMSSSASLELLWIQDEFHARIDGKREHPYDLYVDVSKSLQIVP